MGVKWVAEMSTNAISDFWAGRKTLVHLKVNTIVRDTYWMGKMPSTTCVEHVNQSERGMGFL